MNQKEPGNCMTEPDTKMEDHGKAPAPDKCDDLGIPESGKIDCERYDKIVSAVHEEYRRMGMKATVGRIVHVADENGSTCAAIITQVHGENCINANRFNRDGTMEFRTSLVLCRDEPKGDCEWRWPPRS